MFPKIFVKDQNEYLLKLYLLRERQPKGTFQNKTANKLQYDINYNVHQAGNEFAVCTALIYLHERGHDWKYA